LLPLLKPIGEVESCRFADWRNQAVSLSESRCASAVYSRPDGAWLLLANLDQEARQVTCMLRPEKLPYPLARLTSAERVPTRGGPAGGPNPPGVAGLDIGQLTGAGVRITLPGDDAVLVRVR
jgi:hypothetical protein